MAQVLLKSLLQQQTGLMLDVAAAPALMPLFERMVEVNQVLALPFKHGELSLLKRIRLGRALRAQRYDFAWVLPNSWKSALVPLFARAKQRTGWLGEMRYLLLNDWRKLDKQRLPLMAERFLALGRSSADWQQWLHQITVEDNTAFIQRYPQLLPSLQVSPAQLQSSCRAVNFQADESRPLLALCPGAAFGWSKRWLPDYFSEVANHYLQRGFAVAIFGQGEADQAAAETIMAATAQQCHNFVGRTTLAQAIDLLSLADVVVTNDSGLMHIACALNRRVVAIYGSSSPDFTPPLGRQVAICYLAIACSPCFARDCPLKHFRCMRELLPQQVISAIDQLYAQTQRGQV
ncbi:MAG: lipopolysaccharide heptosyltransferase II [Gammaproteobacteria bacterium]|nr:lipopolysaccharide heptosyltransferase II [Gammaproteobacteria bacterium]